MKKIFLCAAVVAAAAFGVMKATDVNTNSDMSDLQLENLELLAEGEPTPADCNKVCHAAYACHCDIAYAWDTRDFLRCEGYWPN